MNNTCNSHHKEARSWQARLFNACMPQLVQTMRLEAACDYRFLIRDLDVSLAPAFEREVARTLSRDDGSELIPAETLMPVMMQRFALSKESFDSGEAELFKDLVAVCNGCSMVGSCWKSLRAKASKEACRGFCPNAPVLEQKAQSSSD